MKQRLFTVLFLWAGLTTSLCAQSITGSITGVVTDVSGAVIPGAAVTVSNTDTNVGTTVQTDSSGNYTAPLLPRGNYRLEVTAKGFKRIVREGIVLQAAANGPHRSAVGDWRGGRIGAGNGRRGEAGDGERDAFQGGGQSRDHLNRTRATCTRWCF